MNRCEYCGRSVPDGNTECPSCGAAVREKTTAEKVSETVDGVVTGAVEGAKKAAKSMSERTLRAIVVLVLAVLVGFLGVHRFYQGKIASGIIWFLTFGLFGVGVLVDIILAIVELCSALAEK